MLPSGTELKGLRVVHDNVCRQSIAVVLETRTKVFPRIRFGRMILRPKFGLFIRNQVATDVLSKNGVVVASLENFRQNNMIKYLKFDLVWFSWNPRIRFVNDCWSLLHLKIFLESGKIYFICLVTVERIEYYSLTTN